MNDYDDLVATIRNRLEQLRILSNPVFEGFYIGKTSNLSRRRAEHLGEGYTSVEQLGSEDNIESISELEEKLIQYFMDDDRCLNKNEGSVGREADAGNNYVLYLALKQHPLSTNDPELWHDIL